MFVVVLCNGVVFAHGNEAHIVGTVTAVDAYHVVVKTRQGKTSSIRVNTETRYRNYHPGPTAATRADLKVGARVRVDTTGAGDTLTDSAILFASASEKPSAEPETHSHTGTHSH